MIRLIFFRTLCTFAESKQIFAHVPALLNEVIHVFNSDKNKTVLDLTFGFGGHSKALLQSGAHIDLFAFDRDPVAVTHAVELSKSYLNLRPIKGRFSELNVLAAANNILEKSVDFIVMDLGSSSMQMDDESRGFSLSKNAKLDMRMDQTSNDISALDVINNLGAAQLADIFKKYGDEKEARKIANMIVEFRTTVGPIVTTHQLADLVFSFARRKDYSDTLGRKAHPATRIFLALRIFVNDELNELCSALTFAEKYLRPVSGRCVIISFQSSEDRLVKWIFSGKDFRGIDKSVAQMVIGDCDRNEHSATKWFQDGSMITPSDEEIERNPRVRSARMRIGRIYSEER